MYNDSFRIRYGNAPVAISSTENFGSTPAHIHNEIELLYIARGMSEIQIANHSFLAHAGDLLIVNPLEVHGIAPMQTQPYCHRCICFDLSLIADRKMAEQLQKGQIFIPHHFLKGEKNTDMLRELFCKLYASVVENGPALLFDVTAVVSMMFSLLVGQNLLQKNTIGDKQILFCAEITEFIEKHYPEPITSRKIAEALFYTQNYFCRKFKYLFGVSFSEYLTMYRLLRAKEILSGSNDKIVDVAIACGFNDATYFTKSFKKVFGITPLKWQKSQRKTKT